MILACCYPSYRSQVHVGHLFQTTNLALAAASAPGNSILMSSVDTCFIDLARNTLLHGVIKRGADWALFCDADTFQPNVQPIIDMVNEGQGLGAAVIAAPVQLRGKPNPNVQIAEKYLEWADVEDKVQPVDRIGTAFMAINCKWIRANWSKHPWFLSRVMDTEEPSKMSEDFEFCDGVRRRGGAVYADGRFQPAHAGITNELAVFAEIDADVIELGEVTESTHGNGYQRPNRQAAV